MSESRALAGPNASRNTKLQSDFPIKHLIVLMLENRSFDHMLGYLDLPNLENLVNKDYTNTDTNGNVWHTTHDAEPSGLIDPGHDFADVCVQLYGSRDHKPECSKGLPASDPLMQGFVRSYAEQYDSAHPGNIMHCFEPKHVPVLTTLATEYAVCDHWFSSIPGPTLPNRLFAHAGTADGRLDISAEEFGTPLTVYQVLSERNIGATIYAGGWTAASTFWNLMKEQDQYFGTLDDFYQDCYDDNLPGYSFIEPRYSPGVIDGVFRPQNDQHPDSDVAQGELLIYSVYQAIRSNPKVWKSSMLVIVYDEHGGIYDHVPPPVAIPPDDKPSLTPRFNFDRYGVRVPAVIVSAYTDHVVCSDVFDHTSLIATARKVLTGTYQDDRLGKRAHCANTFDTAKILNLSQPRAGLASINAPTCKPNLQKSHLNHLQISHLRQALCLNQKLPKNLQVTPKSAALKALGPNSANSDFGNVKPEDAEHFSVSVTTTLRHLSPKFREMLEKPCSVKPSHS